MLFANLHDISFFSGTQKDSFLKNHYVALAPKYHIWLRCTVRLVIYDWFLYGKD